MVEQKLDINSPIPLYYQLKEIFNSKIDSGEWNADQLIPTEVELIERYQVSRTTVREAINALVQEGKLVKKQGVGTTVCKPRFQESLGKLTGFAEEMISRGITPGAKLLEIKRIQPPKHVREKLLEGKDEEVLFIKRIRLADEEPIAVERSYWPIEIGEKFEGQDLSNIAFYTFLEQQGIFLKEADENIRAQIISDEDASLLGMPETKPVVEMERLAYSRQKQPIEYTVTCYRYDRYSYYVHLIR